MGHNGTVLKPRCIWPGKLKPYYYYYYYSSGPSSPRNPRTAQLLEPPWQRHNIRNYSSSDTAHIPDDWLCCTTSGQVQVTRDTDTSTPCCPLLLPCSSSSTCCQCLTIQVVFCSTHQPVFSLVYVTIHVESFFFVLFGVSSGASH